MTSNKSKRNFKKEKYVLHLKGPGIAKALQEAVDAGKDLVTVPVYSKKTGKVVRIGYFLADKGEATPPDWRTKIKWLKKNEVSVSYAKADVNSREAELSANYLPPQRLEKKGKEFLITLDLIGKIMRFRNIFTVHGSNVSFVIQLEAFGVKSKRWNAIVRYDCAHEYVHRDLIYLDGRKEKQKLEAQNLDEAIRIAIIDLKDNFKQWLLRLGYRGLLNTLPSEIKIKKEFEKAEKFLLDLIKHPEKISKIPSTYEHLYYHSIWTPLP